MKLYSRIFRLFVFIILLPVSLPQAAPPMVRAKHAMVVSGHRLASEVGIEVLRNGGNAIDAAVAVGFTLAVVFPEAGNIGGGGFMMIRMSDGHGSFIDFRERAPQASSRDMFLDSTGNVTQKGVDGHLSAGVPGTVAGFLKALDEFGTKDREELISPAIQLAERGFEVDQRLDRWLNEYEEILCSFPSTQKIVSPGGMLLAQGDTFRQPELATTLQRISDHGHDGFYSGETARLIVEEMKRGGGNITLDDLDEYEAIVREPLAGRYRGHTFLVPPLPSSGGICLLQLLNMVEGYDLEGMGFHSSRSIHHLTEAMKRTFADRAEFLGDPGFVRAPVERLVSKEYGFLRRNEIDTLRATNIQLVTHGRQYLSEGENTTHYSVVDAFGNVVAVTYTLNDLFGSKVVVDGAGFLLNDQMDDFSAKPGVPNIFGLIGGDANAIEPAKRPLSSMSPTIVLKNGTPYIILGARGGSKIITAVFQTIINVIDYGMTIDQAVNMPRFSHQWYPDELSYERYSLPEDVLYNLAARGHTTKAVNGSLGQLEAILIDSASGWIYGGPDHREGGVVIGY